MKRLVLLAALTVLFQSVPAFSASKSYCPDKVLSSGNIEGIYLGTECGDQCYSKIRLDNGEIFELLCREDSADTFFGTESGGRVKASFDLQQFWSEFNEGHGICVRTEVCKSGTILAEANGDRTKASQPLAGASPSNQAPKKISSAELIQGVQSTHFDAFSQKDGFAPIGQAFNSFFDKPVWEETDLDPRMWAVSFKGIAQMGGKNARFVFTFFGFSKQMLIEEGGPFNAVLEVNGVRVSDNVLSDVLGAIYLN